MITALLGVAAFIGMEGVSYAAHRWIMHGPAMVWHRSHHAAPTGRFERNDLFPVVFSVVGVAMFLLASGPLPVMWGPAIGVTAYGFVYALVHDVYIHRRLPLPIPSNRYVRWLRDSHRDHHTSSGEPYGMLLPLVRGAARPTPVDALDRSSARSSRARL